MRFLFDDGRFMAEQGFSGNWWIRWASAPDGKQRLESAGLAQQVEIPRPTDPRWTETWEASGRGQTSASLTPAGLDHAQAHADPGKGAMFLSPDGLTTDLEVFAEDPWTISFARRHPDKPPIGPGSILLPGGVARVERGEPFNPVEIHHLFAQRLDFDELARIDPHFTNLLLRCLPLRGLGEYASYLFTQVLHRGGVPFNILGDGRVMVAGQEGPERWLFVANWRQVDEKGGPYVTYDPDDPFTAFAAVVLSPELGVMAAYLLDRIRIEQYSAPEKGSSVTRSRRLSLSPALTEGAPDIAEPLRKAQAWVADEIRPDLAPWKVQRDDPVAPPAQSAALRTRSATDEVPPTADQLRCPNCGRAAEKLIRTNVRDPNSPAVVCQACGSDTMMSVLLGGIDPETTPSAAHPGLSIADQARINSVIEDAGGGEAMLQRAHEEAASRFGTPWRRKPS